MNEKEELLEKWAMAPELDEQIIFRACENVIYTVIRIIEGFIITSLRKLDGIAGLHRNMADDEFGQLATLVCQPINGLRPAILSKDTM